MKYEEAELYIRVVDIKSTENPDFVHLKLSERNLLTNAAIDPSQKEIRFFSCTSRHQNRNHNHNHNPNS